MAKTLSVALMAAAFSCVMSADLDTALADDAECGPGEECALSALQRKAVVAQWSRSGWHKGIDWKSQNKLPPWMSSITEGADEAIAVVLGQSLKPDGSAPQVLLDRAAKAKQLLEQGTVTKIVVTGGDTAGVGHTEASLAANVLVQAGIPQTAILQEAQATTTAENAWFTLRWIPKGTGRVFIITSDFHMARATYIFQEVFNHFYGMMEQTYKDDPRWTATPKRYPRLEIVQAPTASFCGSNASSNHDHESSADINSFSLAKRARDELKFLGSGEVTKALYGQPLVNILYIWPIQINATKDPDGGANLKAAMAQAMNTAEALCECVSPPGEGGPELPYPLQLPAPQERQGSSDWHNVCPDNSYVA
ncbi:unnamed protein product [Symbiodinium natans]|uniref:DUF218 domain-containing protein n=1 Tax=Symbiodinium natans TaxID=878477 RepID=A0A812IHE6_9DINO|nr:unnamed protein product [Symbiodinium natans]